MVDFNIGAFLQWAVGAFCLVLGWFMRELWAQIKEVRKEVDELKLDLAKNYVSYERFKDFRTEVLEVLKRVETRLDSRLSQDN